MESHYSSTVLHRRRKKYSPAESRRIQVETVPNPKGLESGTSKHAFRFFLTD